jgi:hypothetical protein
MYFGNSQSSIERLLITNFHKALTAESDVADFHTDNVDDAVQKFDDDEEIENKQLSNDINQESTTSSGRNIRKPARCCKDFGAVAVNDIYDLEAEAFLVDTAIGEGIGHTGELQAVNIKKLFLDQKKRNGFK